MRRFTLTVLVMTIGLAPSLTAQGRVSIAPEGATEIRLVASNKETRATITTARVASDSRLFPVGDSLSDLSDVSFVTNLTVRVADADVFVFRSAFTDLINPSTAELRLDGRNYILIIGCRDGAEAFRAEISFDSSHVTRRRVFSSLTPRDASEDTRYKLTIFGQ
jgi:hypothetical protein